MTQAEADQLKKLIDGMVEPKVEINGSPVEAEVPKKDLPEGKRAVRTKSSGDRVYLLDEVKKTRQWITNPEVLAKLGFDQSDVVEVDDAELLKFNMGPALYRIE